jgi:threonine dehydrogenase-like Zn-dependent dehydrogenase
MTAPSTLPGATSPAVGGGRSAAAAVLERPGEPVTVRSFPVPAAPPGGLVVDVEYGGVCGTDLHLQQGHLATPVPLVLGHEGLGTVAEIGAGGLLDAVGRPLAVGDRVMWASSIACGTCVPCRQYREPTLCVARRTYGVNRTAGQVPAGESALAGSWAESIVLHPRTTVVALDDDVDPIAAMSLACAGPTVMHALRERRPVRVGETVVVQGSGPVGLAAAALAQLSGAARVIVVGGPAGRLATAAGAGIGDQHIDVTTEGGPDAAVEAVLAATGGGADLVIECAGVPSAVPQGVAMCRRGGSYLVIGQYTDAGDTMINPHQIVYRQLDVVGSWAFTGAHLVEYVALLPALTARFDLAALVSSYPLTEVGTALTDVASGTVMKAVLATDRSQAAV